MRSLALFVVVAGAVAVVVVFMGREAGVGEQVGAGRASDLALTLSAEPTCETKRAREFWGSRLKLDEDGNPTGRYDLSAGWYGFAETPVRWTVTGGSAPYTLEIDGESRDGFGSYEGASGTASVSCALTPGEVIYKDYDQERRYRTKPVVDSGRKAIRATVTDADGNTADASIEIYAILRIEGGVVSLSGGKTYSIKGTLITVPDGLEATYGGRIHLDCSAEATNCEDQYLVLLRGPGYRGELYIGADTGTHGSRVRIGDIYGRDLGPSGQADAVTEAEIQANLDRLGASVGQQPRIGD